MLYLLANRTADALVRLKARLGDERRRLNRMVEAMADGLILTDSHRDQVLINPAARRLLGIEGVLPVTQQFLKQTLGFYPFDLVAPGDAAGVPLREDVRVKDKMLHSMVSPVRDANGKLDEQDRAVIQGRLDELSRGLHWMNIRPRYLQP